MYYPLSSIQAPMHSNACLLLDSLESPEKRKRKDQKVNITMPLFIHYSTAI